MNFEKEVYNKERGVFVERIPEHSDAWHDRRIKGIGASDIGRILGLNDYEGGSCIEIFQEKIGLRPAFREGNKFTFWGHKQEQLIADAWKFYDGTEDGYIKNEAEDKKQRDCRNVSGFFSNAKYPHLFTNLDRMINKGGFRLDDGSILSDNAILEVKTASFNVAKKWEGGIDPAYVMQVQQQMMIMGLEYAEIALLELDRRNLKVFPMALSPNLVNQIEEESYTFWYKMVEPAKALAQEYLLENERGNFDKTQKIMAEIQKLEPSADASERYKDFMNERWLSEPNILKASPEIIQNIIELKYFKEVEAAIKPESTLRENRIREFFGDAVSELSGRTPDTLDCEEYGKVTWKTQGAEGKTKVLRTQGFKADVSELVESVKNTVIAKSPQV
jgi:putative phage-type endonuclease